MVKATRKRVYVVERLFGFVWENCWTADGKPQTFATRAQAEAAIREHLEDVRDAVALGHMSDEYEADEFRVSVAGAPEGES